MSRAARPAAPAPVAVFNAAKNLSQSDSTLTPGPSPAKRARGGEIGSGVIAACFLALMLLLAADVAAAEVNAKRCDDRVTVTVDGQPFTEYLVKSGTKPILWPIIGPTGKAMTRAYPMGKAPNEREDHIHQRSLWFTHGLVNGVSYWMEVGKEKPGIQEHREFVEVRSGPEAVIITKNDWVDPDGKKQLEDRRTLTFGATQATRWIDFDVTLLASVGDVVFGDTKEGTFGIRVAETMKVDAKTGGKIVNSDGLTDKDAWGKRASWVDYHGPVDGETVGIAVLNHPSSFQYPTYWHVRTYGLFAANPFGPASFAGKKEGPPAHVLPKGQSLRLRYRVILHRGDEKEGQIAPAFAEYAK